MSARSVSGPKMPSSLAGVEAERVEPPLELGDVVAAQHRPAAVEQAVAEVEAALDERRPGLGAADAVDTQAAQLPGSRAPPIRCAGPYDARARRGGIVVSPGAAEADAARSRTALAAAARPADGRIGSSDELGEVLQQLALALGADEPLGRLAVLEHEQRGDAHDLEAARGVGVVVDVELARW